MGAMLGAGCLLIAYGPSASLLLLYAARRSALLVLTIASAFVWLLSILAASVVWIAIPPLQAVHPFTAVVGVVSQALGRWLTVWLFVQTESRADAMQLRSAKKWRVYTEDGDNSHRLKMFNDLSAALALGLGFGAMHTVMMYGALLGTSVSQEAAYYLDTCPNINAFVMSAVTALFYNILHIALMIVALDRWRRGTRWRAVIVPASAHLLFTLASLFNLGGGGMCAASLPLQAVVLAAAVVTAVRAVRAPDYAATKQIRAWTMLVQSWDETEQQQQQMAMSRSASSAAGRSSALHQRPPARGTATGVTQAAVAADGTQTSPEPASYGNSATSLIRMRSAAAGGGQG